MGKILTYIEELLIFDTFIRMFMLGYSQFLFIDIFTWKNVSYMINV